MRDSLRNVRGRIHCQTVRAVIAEIQKLAVCRPEQVQGDHGRALVAIIEWMGRDQGVEQGRTLFRQRRTQLVAECGLERSSDCRLNQPWSRYSPGPTGSAAFGHHAVTYRSCMTSTYGALRAKWRLFLGKPLQRLLVLRSGADDCGVRPYIASGHLLLKGRRIALHFLPDGSYGLLGDLSHLPLLSRPQAPHALMDANPTSQAAGLGGTPVPFSQKVYATTSGMQL